VDVVMAGFVKTALKLGSGHINTDDKMI